MTFEHKSWIFLALLLSALFVVLVFYARTRRNQQITQFASQRLLQELLRTYSRGKSIAKNALIGLSILLLCLALSRPQFGYTLNEVQSRGIDVLFVLDTSNSMLAEDLKPNRLERAKLAILDFIKNFDSDRVGITAFAGNAFLQCPLTLEYDAFRLSLDVIDTNIIPRGGTDIGRAIDDAQAAFSSDNNHKIMVLITDGEDLEGSAIVAAERAAANNVTIFTIGVGTTQGGLIPIDTAQGLVQYLRDDQDKVVNTQLDETTLQEIAQVTGGFYANLGPAGLGLQQVYEYGLKKIPQQDLNTRLQRTPNEYFQWVLGLCILLLFLEPLISDRRQTSRLSRNSRSKAAALANVTIWIMGIGIIACPIKVHAAPGDREIAKGDYPAAIEKITNYLEDHPLDHRMRYNLGFAYFQDDQIPEAIEAWKAALSTEKVKLQSIIFYNLGNAHYRLGQSQLAAVDQDPSIGDALRDAETQTQAAVENGRTILAQNDLAARKVAWEQCEELVKKIDANIQAVDKQITESKATIASWETALNQYATALELQPADEDARLNRETVSAKRQSLLDKNSELEGMIAAQKELKEQLISLIAALKAPTQLVIDAEKYAQMLIEQGHYVEAYGILSQTAQKDPTAEKFAEKQNRTGEIVGILEPNQHEPK